MFSNLVELAGLAAGVDGVYLLAGRGWAMLAACAALCFIGAATNDASLGLGMRRVATSPRTGYRALRRRRAIKRAVKQVRASSQPMASEAYPAVRAVPPPTPVQVAEAEVAVGRTQA